MAPADGPGEENGPDGSSDSGGPDGSSDSSDPDGSSRSGGPDGSGVLDDEDAEPVQASWPELSCWGCGPANDAGLHLESYVAEDGATLVATVDPDATFDTGEPNAMYGGHVASLVDCHSVWTAMTFAYEAEERPLGSDPRIVYVTGDLCVEFHRPTPLDRPVHLAARVAGDVGRRTTVHSEVGPAGQVTATGTVEAVRVDPQDVAGHHQG